MDSKGRLVPDHGSGPEGVDAPSAGMTDTQPVVTQEDREAAAKFCEDMTGDIVGKASKIRCGEMDDYTEVKALAACRTASTAALQKQLDMAVEALEQALERLVGVEDWRDGSRPRVPPSDAAIAFIRSTLAAIKEQGA